MGATSVEVGRSWDRQMIARILVLSGLSLFIPPLLRLVEMRLAVPLAPLLEGTGLLAPDVVLLMIGALGAIITLVLRRPHIGFSFHSTRLNRYTAGLVLLALLPSIVMSDGLSFTPDFGWLTTAVAEEVICRGLWFGIVVLYLRRESRDTDLLSAPVLLSTLFFVTWHVPADGTWPGLGFVLVGVYKALTLGFLRAHSGSLYLCILVHCAKLAL